MNAKHPRKTLSILVGLVLVLTVFPIRQPVVKAQAPDSQLTEQEIIALARMLYAPSQAPASLTIASTEQHISRDEIGECGTMLAIQLYYALQQPGVSEATRQHVETIQTQLVGDLVTSFKTSNFEIHYAVDTNGQVENDEVPNVDTDAEVVIGPINLGRMVSASQVYSDTNAPDYIEIIGKALEHSLAQHMAHGFNGGQKPTKVGDVYVKDIAGLGVAFPSNGQIHIDNEIVSKYGISREGILVSTVAHELFHQFQFTYAVPFIVGDGYHNGYGWIVEGTARWGEDTVFDSVPAYIVFPNGVNDLLRNPDRTLKDDAWRYQVSLFWKYFSEQLTSQTSPADEPQVGSDVIDSLWSLLAGQDGNYGQDAANEVIRNRGQSRFGSSIDFDGFFEHWVVANYAKRLYQGNPTISSNYDGLYDYLEDSDGYSQVPFENPADQRDLSAGTIRESGKQSVNPWASDYYSYTIGADVANLIVKLDGELNLWPAGNLCDPSYQVLLLRNGQVADILRDRHTDHTFSTSNGPGYDGMVVVVGNRDNWGAGRWGLCVGASGNYNLTVEASSASPNILAPTQVAPDLVGSATMPYKTQVDVEVKTSGGTFVNGLSAASFNVTIGGRSATVLTARELSDKYVLEIQPPTQPSDGSYDLTVTVFGNSDTETEAIQYSSLAQNNIDTVLVIDRSGSMGGTPIQNARDSAKMFVDLMNNQDMIGVVSFSSYSRVDFPLITITSTVTQDTAKSAIDTISAYGNTSIGAGLRDGRDELTGKGNTNHPWSIVLLSDGQENRAPYVSEILPSIVSTKIKIFSIGLGSVDEALMQDIAYQTGGQYYYTPSDCSAPLKLDTFWATLSERRASVLARTATGPRTRPG